MENLFLIYGRIFFLSYNVWLDIFWRWRATTASYLRQRRPQSSGWTLMVLCIPTINMWILRMVRCTPTIIQGIMEELWRQQWPNIKWLLAVVFITLYGGTRNLSTWSPRFPSPARTPNNGWVWAWNTWGSIRGLISSKYRTPVQIIPDGEHCRSDDCLPRRKSPIWVWYWQKTTENWSKPGG